MESAVPTVTPSMPGPVSARAVRQRRPMRAVRCDAGLIGRNKREVDTRAPFGGRSRVPVWLPVGAASQSKPGS